MPDNDFAYNYTNARLRLQIGDFDFFTDAEPGKSSRLFRFGAPGTDGYLVRKFLDDKGYKYPDEYAYARLVHIPDAANRKELLIIFIDDLEPIGVFGQQTRYVRVEKTKTGGQRSKPHILRKLSA